MLGVRKLIRAGKLTWKMYTSLTLLVDAGGYANILNSQEIKRSIILMKARFLLVYGISQVYSEVSLSYILPGINKINSLGLSCDPASSGESALKKADLKSYTQLASNGVKALTHQARTIFNFSIMAYHRIIRLTNSCRGKTILIEKSSTSLRKPVPQVRQDRSANTCRLVKSLFRLLFSFAFR